MSSTHPNSILLDILNSMSQREDIKKIYFDIFGSIGCDPSTSSLAIDQNIEITLSWFLLIRFQS